MFESLGFEEMTAPQVTVWFALALGLGFGVALVNEGDYEGQRASGPDSPGGSVDIPPNKKIRYSLRYIHGIGPQYADEIIEKHADNWEIHRIAVIDRSLLRMATTELLKFEEIPPKVSVDEAIEIAKKYSTPRSGTFVNGVIDAILLDLHDQGRLNKTGRGLIGMDAIRERADSS